MRTLRIPLVLLLTVLFVFGSAAIVLAAPNDDVIQALKDGKVPEIYIIQAENYLKTQDLTQAEADAVITQVDKAADIMEEAGVKKATELSDADKQEMLAAVTKAAEDIGLTLSVKKNSGGTYTIVGEDSTGKEVVNLTSNEVKQTGVDNTLLFIGLILILAAAGSAFAVKRYTSSASI